ncbi:hypothetical protein CHELA1G11_21105 [Hyphomicrobiales bacterium]|nr:hypothetical protein CHELA1G11_21105 [Hyphomicrobiales bacterium]CAH1693333.1 hypothetical protein CHELA1G2_21413 [Hyphomicrobiales bacterium]
MNFSRKLRKFPRNSINGTADFGLKLFDSHFVFQALSVDRTAALLNFCARR